MKTLKDRYPRIWCVIVTPIAMVALVLAAIFAYVCHFLSNLKRIWLNLWDDLVGIFSTPYRETRSEVSRYTPWGDIANTWKSASK